VVILPNFSLAQKKKKKNESSIISVVKGVKYLENYYSQVKTDLYENGKQTFSNQVATIVIRLHQLFFLIPFQNLMLP
jgi:phage-related minor tail protein